jgi:hypothetical protein
MLPVPLLITSRGSIDKLAEPLIDSFYRNLFELVGFFLYDHLTRPGMRIPRAFLLLVLAFSYSSAWAGEQEQPSHVGQ